MSHSSLPDIFLKTSTVPLRAQKQGGPFSLHLNNYSSEHHQSSRAGYAPGDLCYVTLNSTRTRAISLQTVKPKSSLRRNENSKRTDEGRSKMKVGFRQDFDLLNDSIMKQKVGISVVNCTNFPYETSRRFSSTLVDMEEAESLKNKVESTITEVSIARKSFEEIKTSNKETKTQLTQLEKSISQELEEFRTIFQGLLQDCYGALSSMRRETNEELKENRQAFEKVKAETQICTSFAYDMLKKAEEMYGQCLSVPEDEARTFKESGSRGEYNNLQMDFEEISSIRKSSRGATGDQSRRTRIMQLLKKNESTRKSMEIHSSNSERDKRFLLNGREIDLLNFQDEL